ncbi:MAG: SDR family oxidoreductase [Caulobacteraceae bacterium]|nr:SDR family oxidoreductase [Caulobacteraceae bacterium]
MAPTVLITGCSTGIGRAAAERFQTAGWNVAATMRDPRKAGSLAELDRVAVLPLDVLDEVSIEAAYLAATTRFGGIDVLVNNAGSGLFGPFEEANAAAVRDQIDTNLLGPIWTIRRILPHFRARRAGLVINVTSLAAFLGPPFNSYYAATKWGLEGLTEALAAELASFGIRFKLVEPGLTRSSFHIKFAAQDTSPITDYDGFRQKVTEAILPGGTTPHGAPPEGVAEVLFQAATDPSPRLRYPAGADAAAILAMRDSMSAEDFVAAMRKQFPT